MMKMSSPNFGSVYSFEPGFFRAAEDNIPYVIEEQASYHFDKTDSLLSGLMAMLVFLLLLRMVFSFSM